MSRTGPSSASLGHQCRCWTGLPCTRAPPPGMRAQKMPCSNSCHWARQLCLGLGGQHTGAVQLQGESSRRPRLGHRQLSVLGASHDRTADFTAPAPRRPDNLALWKRGETGQGPWGRLPAGLRQGKCQGKGDSHRVPSEVALGRQRGPSPRHKAALTSS